MAKKEQKVLLVNELDKTVAQTIDDAGKYDAAIKKNKKLLDDFKKGLKAKALEFLDGLKTVVLNGHKYQAVMPITVTFSEEALASMRAHLGEAFVQEVETVHVSDPEKLWQVLGTTQRKQFMTKRTVYELKDDVDPATLKGFLAVTHPDLFETETVYVLDEDNLSELLKTDTKEAEIARNIVAQAEASVKSISLKKL